MIVKKSKKYKVSPRLLSAILMQESSYKLNTVNRKCINCKITDYGISQIHYKNLNRFNLDPHKLISDLDYSVDAGARILAHYKKFSDKEPNLWWSRFNCGNRPYHKVKSLCDKYKLLVSRWM